MPIKTQAFAGDGTSRAGKTFELTLCDPASGLETDVVVTCRVITRAEALAHRARHTTMVVDPKTRSMVPRIDEMAAANSILTDIVVGWNDNMIGADDLPLVCIPDTIVAMDDRLKTQIIERAMGGEVTGRGPETFRRPAPVPALVARLREDDDVLSSRHAG